MNVAEGRADLDPKFQLRRLFAEQGVPLCLAIESIWKGDVSASQYPFDVINRALRDPWQQWGVTEIALLRSGNFGTDVEIAHQTALLCRNAPMWEGNLRLPAPMHMAKQIAQDHPLIEIHRRIYTD